MVAALQAFPSRDPRPQVSSLGGLGYGPPQCLSLSARQQASGMSLLVPRQQASAMSLLVR
jgi:hypothetical protein